MKTKTSEEHVSAIKGKVPFVIANTILSWFVGTMVGGALGPMTGAAVGIAMYALLDQQFGLGSIAFEQAHLSCPHITGPQNS